MAFCAPIFTHCVGVTRMVMSPVASGRVLVKLSEVTQELTVGIGGATASVRTLTSVSLEVREQELIVLSGSRGAGERAVLAVVAGDRRGVTGTCDVHAGVRVRIMRIAAPAALALAQEWPRAETLAHFAGQRSGSEAPGPATSTTAGPEIFLLDVVPAESEAGAPKPWNEHNRAALLAWAGVCRSRGGAVIMAAGDAVGRGIFDHALDRLAHVRGRATAKAAVVREVRFEASTVRVVPMHAGRVAAHVRLRPRDLAT